MIKKKVNIILLILVLSLWGTVIYKYINHLFINDKGISNNQNEIIFSQLKIKDKDTFNLVTLKRDPFLNKSYSLPSNNYTNYKTTTYKTVRKLNEQRVNPSPVKQIVNEGFPRIQYYGYIKSEDKKQEVVLLNVNGKLVKLHTNESKDNLKIISLNKDSVKVGFNNQSKWISIR